MVHQIKRYFFVFLGAMTCSAAINAFYVPNHMLNGGVSGVAMILYFILQVPMALTSIAINVPLFYYAYKLMDRNYFFLSLFGMFVFSFTLDGFRFMADWNLTQDLTVAAICGGLGNGIGAALMYRVNGGSGGTDIIGGILNKYYGITIASVGFILNTIIMGICVFLFGVEIAVYTFIGIYITAQTADRLTAGLETRKSIFIISNSYTQIAEDIFKEVGRGVTYLTGEGAFTHQERKVVFVVIKLTQIAKIKFIVQKHDPQAFMIIQEATDVLGKGFTIKSDLEIKKELLQEKKKLRLKNIARIHKQRIKEDHDRSINHEKN